MATLRDRQKAAIERILNLNAPIEPGSESNDVADPTPPSTNAPILSENGEPIWKVLVFDDFSRDVVSSVLRVNDLRSHGVTLYLNINTSRHAIPDVPVIYLIDPNPANLQIVTSDLSRDLYSTAYINFLTSISRPLLEDFGGQTVSSGTADHIAQLYDQTLNYLVTEADLFSLGIDGAYRILNSAKTTDAQLDITIDKIVSGLFSVVVTLGTIPIIRCPKGGAAEMISAKLDRKVRDHILNSQKNLFSGADRGSSAAVSSRPVLIIVDRNVDLIPMFSHSWTYQSLIHDVLDMRLNKITMSVPNDENNLEKGFKKQSYDLTSSDAFWARNALAPFPQVIEEVTNELAKWTEDSNELTKKTGTSSLDDLQADANSSAAAHLKAAITQLPELRERKGLIDMHMNILNALSTGLKERKIDEYFELEQNNVNKQTKAQIMELIKNPEKGNEPQDKTRLFIQWYLTTEQDVSRSDLDGFIKALQEAGADTTSINYVKTVRQLTRMTMISSAPTQPAQQSSDLFRGFSSISSRVTDRLKDAGLSANLDGLVSGIKNMLPVNKDSTLAKITESIMDPQNASSSAISKTESYLYFDPRSANARGTLPPASQARNQQSTTRGIEASFGQKRQGFSEAIVFPVGGGSTEEYANLCEWTKRTSAGQGGTAQKRRIVYGSTGLLSPTEFIKKDLEVLGKESP
ncbi:putative Golgi transport protein Sly1 [Polyplosphaeria fusca]|uniref:Golgi transport protein Sly1 n=1 Tax=Polyplosphaeria fusca TaxID=682080 RepID=A0A9P4R078_9PLEO|nr:putative Golgi transport protein Sly1 [Polyplosphaeria fusca]